MRTNTGIVPCLSGAAISHIPEISNPLKSDENYYINVYNPVALVHIQLTMRLRHQFKWDNYFFSNHKGHNVTLFEIA